VAGCVALTAFSVAILSGLAAGRRTDLILQNALLFLLYGQIAGYILAHIVKFAVNEGLAHYRQTNPLPASAQTDTTAHHTSTDGENS